MFFSALFELALFEGPVEEAAETGGGLRHYPARKRRYVDPDFWEKRERGFSRKIWEELQAARRAQLEAERQAEEEKNERRKRALERAAKIAAQAIKEAEEAEVVTDLASMTRSLEAASGATTVALTIRRADAAIAWAKAVIESIKIREEEEEEEAVVLLLLN